MISSNEAQQLIRNGRIDEAQRAYEAILERSPGNVEALNALGVMALRQGQARQAVELLTKAATSDPQDALTQHQLARALHASGNLVSATLAQQRAVQLNAEFFVARLHLGELLEMAGERQQALLHYGRALRDAQDKQRWINPQTTPEPLRPLVEHAVLTFRAGRRELLLSIIEPLARRHGASSLARVERCLRIHLGEEAAPYSDPRQQPTFLYFPDLPASPYMDRDLCPWLADLEVATASIQSELSRLIESSQGRERVFTSDELEKANLQGLRGRPAWDGYYFYRHGEARDENCVLCPNTLQALDALPLCRAREHAPEVFFSVLAPGTRLMPHRGVTNTRIVGHLPLLVPQDCALSVAGEMHEWREGRVVVFDDTYEHEAWNRSESIRVVLIFDIWNPHLTDIECQAIADLVPAIGDFRKALAAV